MSYEIKKEAEGKVDDSDARETFISLMRDDLLTPQAVGHLWEVLRDEDYSPEQKWGLLTTADVFLGLSLIEPPEEVIPQDASLLPEEVQKLVYERDLARGARDFKKADDIRYQLLERGYRVEDSPSGTLLTEERR